MRARSEQVPSPHETARRSYLNQRLIFDTPPNVLGPAHLIFPLIFVCSVFSGSIVPCSNDTIDPRIRR